MKTASKKKTGQAKGKTISKAEIRRRLVELDLAQTSVIRDLEMDINGEPGVDSKHVLEAARKAIG